MNWEYVFGAISVIGTLYTVLEYYKKKENVSSKESNNTRQLSLSIEHTFPYWGISYLEEQKIQISICNSGSQKCSIKRIDWAVAGTSQRSSVEVPFDYPFLVPEEGIFIDFPVDKITLPQMNFEQLSEPYKFEILKSLEIEVVLMTHNECFRLPVPRSLKLAFFRHASTNKFLTWFYEWWL